MKTATWKSFIHFEKTVFEEPSWSSLSIKNSIYNSWKWKEIFLMMRFIKRKKMKAQCCWFYLSAFCIGFPLLITLLPIFGITWTLEELSFQCFVYTPIVALSFSLKSVSASPLSLVRRIRHQCCLHTPKTAILKAFLSLYS